MSNRQRNDGGGSWIAWLIGIAIVIAIVVYSVSGIGHLLDLTPTGSEVLDEEDGYVGDHYEGVALGYILTLLIIAFPVAAYFLWNWWQANRAAEQQTLWAILGGAAALLLVLVVALPVGARDTPLTSDKGRAGKQDSGRSQAELEERREERRERRLAAARERERERKQAIAQRKRREERQRAQAVAAEPAPEPEPPTSPTYTSCDSAPDNISVPPGSDLDADGDGIGCES